MSNGWKSVALAVALIAGAALLLWDGNAPLVRRGPPMLARDARAVTIFLVFGAYWLVLLFLAKAAALAGDRLAGMRRVAALAACAGVAAALVLVASQGIFAAMHVICYAAGVCASFSLPERIMYTLGSSSSAPVATALLVVPAVIGIALAARGRHSALI